MITTPERSEKVNILLVDDQPARLLSYESILNNLDQNLVSARSGLEALELLMKSDFAVILLDVSMPGMDGFETAAMIHDHPRFERTPIIFVTGVHIGELDRLKGYKLGAVDYVSIPIVPEILRSKVSVLVELYQQRQKLEELNSSLAAANQQLERANLSLQEEKTRELERLNRHLQEANQELGDANQALLLENQERERIEHALKEADRHKDEFLAILAHELRNPLAPIRHAVDLMKSQPLHGEPLTWSRDVIDRQSAHLTRLVDDLLDISRINHGTIKLAKENVSVGAILDRAVEALRPVIDAHQHRLEVECVDRTMAVHGDLTRLVQVLGNLLSNAAKYTPPGGRISLAINKLASQVEFRVVDSGIGIPAESLPKLFNLFSRIQQPGATHSESGLGIGLALVRRLVQLHDGEVSVVSKGENQGSEFIVQLPLSNVIAAPTSAPYSLASRSVSRPVRRVLVVDDNLDAQQGLTLLLQLEGHEVLVASDGAQGLELASVHRPDLALLDIGMPIMDGYELARRIRSEDWGRNLRLIALSGWGQPDDVARARDAGFDSHLMKPVTYEVIGEILAALGGDGADADRVAVSNR
ncbi:MAG: response regulator [Povalibacter sp.]